MIKKSNKNHMRADIRNIVNGIFVICCIYMLCINSGFYNVVRDENNLLYKENVYANDNITSSSNTYQSISSTVPSIEEYYSQISESSNYDMNFVNQSAANFDIYSFSSNSTEALPSCYISEAATSAGESSGEESGASASTYVTDNLPALRNQKPYGTCWAFASVAASEISIRKQENKELDLSELQLVYFTYDDSEDPLGLISNDKNTVGNNNILTVGGNEEYALYTMASWKGLVSEEDVDYSEAYDVVANGLDNSYAYSKDVAHLRNGFKLNIGDTAVIKEMIVKYGSVAGSYYDLNSNYNSTYYSYYQNSTTSINHAVTIVGWDDDFSADNFNTTPDGNGAWLIRNSWAASYSGDIKYGHNQYFWLSYYDTSLSNPYVFDCVSSDSDEFYDNNYQYDGCVGTVGVGPFVENTNTGIWTTESANIFHVQNEYEMLKAVMIGVNSINNDYKIEIYKNLTDESDPTSGTLVSTKSGTTYLSGDMTIKLDKQVALKKDDSYSVVVYLYGTDSNMPEIEAEANVNSSWIKCDASAGSNESLIYSFGEWQDYGVSEDANLRIKAFTDNVDEVLTDWQKIDNNWYYYGTDGIMVTGWNKISGKWYYFSGSGIMKTGWVKISNKWYYFNGSGVMTTGWKKLSGDWYFFNSSGVMQTGWQKLSNKWYYFNASGEMITGWKYIGGKWYYFNSSGVMLTSQWVGNYYLTADGSMQES